MEKSIFLRKEALYNVGNSSEYMASSIHHIFSGIKHRDWIYFGGNYLQKKDPCTMMNKSGVKHEFTQLMELQLLLAQFLF